MFKGKKGKKLHSYPAKMKAEAVKYTEISGNMAVGRKYAVDEKRIRKWRKNENKLASLMNIKKGQLRKRLQSVTNLVRLASPAPLVNVGCKFAWSFGHPLPWTAFPALAQHWSRGRGDSGYLWASLTFFWDFFMKI